MLALCQGLEKVSTLQQRVTVQYLGLPLGEVVELLTKAGGVKLDAASAVDDLKVTVLMQDEPMWRVMELIAEALGGEWKPDGDLYRISMPSGWQSSMVGAVQREDAKLRAGAQADLRAMLEAARVDPAVVAETLERLSKKGQGALSPAEKDLERAMRFAQDDRNRRFGEALAGLLPQDWNQFWNGRAVATRILNPGSGPPPPPGADLIALRFDPVSFLLRKGVADAYERPEAVAESPLPATDRFVAAAKAWSKAEPSDDERWKRSVDVPNAERGVTAAEVLQRVHRATGLPIAADAFRLRLLAPQGSSTAASLLQSFADRNRGYLKATKAGIAFRHPAFWRLRKMEAPESMYRKLEEKPTLEAYAEFAAKLNEKQQFPFQVRDAVASSVSMKPLEEAMPALRFFASLSPAQRSKAGQGLYAGEMSPGQRDLFSLALTEGLFGLPQRRGSFAPTPPEWNRDELRNLGFLIVRLEGEARLTFGASREQAVEYLVKSGGA